MWKNKKVLVAGGTGMIGICLVELLLERGATVRIAALDDASRAHHDAEYLKLDLTNLENCRTACAGMDFAFNLLGVKASPAMTAKRPASHYYPTIMMEHSLLEAARLEGVQRFQLTSSIGVYAPAEIFREDDVWSTYPSRNDWFGGWAKRVGELQIEAYRKEYEWDGLTITRPANVYGPWDNFDSVNAMVVPSLIKRALSCDGRLEVWGDGSAVRDFVHARDVAHGMMIVAEESPTGPVNLGSGCGYSIRQLVECIVGNLSVQPEVVWDTTKPSGDTMRVMDISRARGLGYAPAISLSEGVAKVMHWYRKNSRLTGARYDVFDTENH